MRLAAPVKNGAQPFPAPRLTVIERRAAEPMPLVRGVSGADDGVRVTVLEEPLAIGIEEATKRVEHRVSFTEQKLIDSGRGWQVPKHDEVPSGRLALVITNVSDMRHRFTESSKPLEQLLNRIIIGLVRAALGLKRQRAEAEAARLKREEEERLRQEEARRLAEAALRWREEEGSRSAGAPGGGVETASRACGGSPGAAQGGRRGRRRH